MDKYEYWWMSVHNEFLPADISREQYSYEEIYGMTKKQLQSSLCLTATQAEYIIDATKFMDIDRPYYEFLSSGVKSVTLHEENYPVKLRYIDDKPYALFYIGELPREDEKNVAIIGSRACSEYGRVMAERLAFQLAGHGIGVISGMALGIDGIAQMHSLNAGMRSYGILGGSVLTCYPRANKVLYERLMTSGAVISEYANSVPPKPAFFPKRNRIISGLSDGVIVVQAKIRSGTFITVDSALSQGKDVLVVPGMVTDPLSVGCNLLIMQGAHPIQCGEDVVNILNAQKDRNEYNYVNQQSLNLHLPKELLPANPAVELTKEEKSVYKAVDYTIKSTEKIAKELNTDICDVLKPLIMLEIKGLIKECGKNQYVKCT